MKKAFYWTVALLSVIYSCTQKEMEIVTPEEPETELIQLTVKASIGETDNTKTAIQSDGTSIYWTQGDAINLFYGELSAGQFTSSITTPSQSTDFSGTLSVATGTTEAGMTARRFWGVYPYNAANSCDGSGVTLTIPSAQKGVPGTFADKLNPTVATSPGLDLTFYNVGSWFIFSVTQENVVSATLRGNNNEDIAGTIRVTMDSNSRPVATVQSGAKIITITPQTGVSFEVGELYYMVLIPQTLSGGYTLTLTKADGSSADCVVSKEAAFARSSYRRKRDADNGLAYTLSEPEAIDLGLSVKWANFNLGAGLPEQYGHYYAWGETEPYYTEGHSQDSPCNDWIVGKTGYNWASYKFCSGYNDLYDYQLTKYNESSYHGTVDFKYVLDPEDDVAHVKLGSNWRMPTKEECAELMELCTWTSTDNYNGTGVKGMTVTGPNGNSIFLPAAGYRFDDAITGIGYGGNYFSSSLSSIYTASIIYIDPSSSIPVRDYYDVIMNRCVGYSVRPVFGEFIPVESITVDKTSLELHSGATRLLNATISPSNATVKEIRWMSSDESVARVDMNGLITATAVGTATITAYGSSGVSSSCTVTVTGFVLIPPDDVQAVDLGLSVKWASCNIGAISPEEYGAHFAWGETQPKSDYGWSTYKYYQSYGPNSWLTKYITDSSTSMVDNKTVLDPQDDAAHVNWGGSWRMPTDEEWTELRDNCTWTWTSKNGVNGSLVTSKTNDKSIFLPAAGYYDGTPLSPTGYNGHYWSSSLYTDGQRYAWSVGIYSNRVNRNHGYRCVGYSVRPVTK